MNIDKEAIKKIARICFTNAKESKEVDTAISAFGIDIQESPLFRLTLHCITPMSAITPDDLYLNDDKWYWDFWHMEDFEEFWNKYYEGRF